MIRHIPFIQTDVFRDGISLRDGRSIETVKAAAPAPLSNYEAWFDHLARRAAPSSSSRLRRLRPWLVGGSLAVWFVAVAAAPLPEGARAFTAVALLAAYVILLGWFLWSWRIVGERIHRALLERPALGDWRAALWFGGFVGYGLLVIAGGALFLVLADSI